MGVSLSLILMFLGGIIFVGFFASELFQKTKVPDSIILIGIGIALSQWGWVDPTVLEPLTAIVSSIAISMILFEAGMSIKFKELTESLGTAFNMANISFVTNSFAIAALTFLFTGWDPLTSLMAGFLLGGTSAAVIIPMAKQILPEDLIVTAELESTITNIYNFIFALSVAKILQSTLVSPNLVINELLSYFSIGVFLGIVISLLWIIFLKKFWGRPFSYMRTLAIILFLYGFAEFAGGSGALASLIFGLMLGNNQALSELIKTPAIGTGRFLKFSQEIAFLIRTYFFLFLGIVLRLPSDTKIWVLAIAIAVIAFMMRALSARILKLPMEMAVLMPRGLGEAVIASLILEMGIPGAEELLVIVGLVIIVTNLFPAIVLNFWKKIEVKDDSQLKSEAAK